MFSYLTSQQETEPLVLAPSPISNVQDASLGVSVIVPTLNEAENIDQILGSIIENLRGRFTFEILVTDGGSTDGTCEKVTRWEHLYAVRLVSPQGTGSLAEDVLAAAVIARFPILVVLDADESHPASSIPELIDAVASGQCDMAIGSRYVEGGATQGWPLHRRLLSQMGAVFASPFTDVSDPLSGFFCIRRDHLLAAGNSTDGFKIGLGAIFSGGDTLEVREIPITFSDRLRGKSKIGPGQLTAYLHQLVRFARGTTSTITLQRFVMVGMAGFIIDLAVASMMRALGADITVAHISGFCFATAFNFIAHSQWSFEGRARGGTQFLRFILISALALAMRGGFVATASNLELPFLLIMLTGIAGGGMVSYLGNEFYVFRSNSFLPPTARWKLAAIAIIAYVTVLRIVYQGNIDLMPQEAYYWNYAQHLAWGYLDHPPMVAWLVWVGTAIFGNTEFGVRAGAALTWAITAFFVFGLAHNLYGRTTAFLSLLLISVFPFFFSIGIVMTPDAPLTAAWAGALYFLERALIGNRKEAWAGAGLCIGLGMLSKYTIALLAPATLVFLIIHPGSRRWFTSKWPYLGAILALILFSPVIIWNATNDWASFHFQGSRRLLTDDIVFSAHTLMMFIAQLLGPLGLWLATKAIAKSAGLGDRRLARSPATFNMAFTFVPLSVFIAFSLFHTVKLNWAGPVWIALLPLMANLLAKAIRHGDQPHLISISKMSVTTTNLVFALALHYLALGLPFIGYSGSFRGLPVAWEEFVSAAEEIKADVEAKTGHTPLLAGMDTYNIASELSFYTRGSTTPENITSQNLIGKGGLMFGVWASSLQPRHPVVIMYSLKERDITDGETAAWFESIGPVQTRKVYKNGILVGGFFYRVGYGFRPPL